jgi:hypothetical protein
MAAFAPSAGVEAALRAFVQEADYASLLALRASGNVAGYDEGMLRRT